MSAANCTTHFHACDCREAMFAEMVLIAERARAILNELTEPDMSVSAGDIYLRARAAEACIGALIARATDQGEMK